MVCDICFGNLVEWTHYVAEHGTDTSKNVIKYTIPGVNVLTFFYWITGELKGGRDSSVFFL